MKEVECKRSNSTPRQFFRYCRQKCLEKGIDIENMVGFQEWSNPKKLEKWHIKKHNYPGFKRQEVVEFMPYNCHLALQDMYNFILEFEFDNRKRGHGYLYAMETEGL